MSILQRQQPTLAWYLFEFPNPIHCQSTLFSLRLRKKLTLLRYKKHNNDTLDRSYIFAIFSASQIREYNPFFFVYKYAPYKTGADYKPTSSHKNGPDNIFSLISKVGNKLCAFKSMMRLYLCLLFLFDADCSLPVSYFYYLTSVQHMMHSSNLRNNAIYTRIHSFTSHHLKRVHHITVCLVC